MIIRYMVPLFSLICLALGGFNVYRALGSRKQVTGGVKGLKATLGIHKRLGWGFFLLSFGMFLSLSLKSLFPLSTRASILVSLFFLIWATYFGVSFYAAKVSEVITIAIENGGYITENLVMQNLGLSREHARRTLFKMVRQGDLIITDKEKEPSCMIFCLYSHYKREHTANVEHPEADKEEVSPPGAEEFSIKTIRQKWLFSLLIDYINTIILGVALLLFFLSSVDGWEPLIYAAFIAGSAVLIRFIYQLIFSENQFRDRHLQQLLKRQKEFEQFSIRKVRNELVQLLESSHLQELAAQALHQYQAAQNGLKNIEEMLNMKLDSREITFAKYFGIAQEATQAIMDNIAHATGFLRSVASIDIEYIEQKIGNLTDGSLAADAKANLESLKRRKTAFNEQIIRAKSLLADNEKALAELERVSQAAANWHISSSDNLTQTVNNLKELADSAKYYKF